MKLLSILIGLLVGASGHTAPTIRSGLGYLTRGLLVMPDPGPGSIGPDVLVALVYPLSNGRVLDAAGALRADIALFEGSSWNASIRGELGASAQFAPQFLAEGAVGIGYMHTWQDQVYVPTGKTYGRGIDYLGSPSLFPSARLGVGWSGGASPGRVRILLCYEVVFQVAPWFAWNHTLMSGWSLSMELSPREAGSV
jgi:hypothetical protein